MLNKSQLFADILCKYVTQKHFSTNCRNCCHFSQTSGSSLQTQESQEIKKCCEILKISYDFDESELRQAFVEGCKRSHPDINSDKEIPNQEFVSIESAYNTLKQYLKEKKKNKQIVDDLKAIEEEEEEQRVRHKVPQHRQYLNFDGIGFGTPTERQKQYQKHRLSKATNSINEFQLNKIKSSDQLSDKNAIVVKDPHLQRQIKTQQGFDRLVEDLIQESMARGDFENLPGYGKPLKHRPEYPYLDSTTYKLNEILINNGFVPQWVLLEKDIREEKKWLKNKLFCLKVESKLDNILFVKQILDQKVTEINKMIDKYNTIVPILSKQQTLINLEKEVIKMKRTDDNEDSGCAHRSHNHMNKSSEN